MKIKKKLFLLALLPLLLSCSLTKILYYDETPYLSQEEYHEYEEDTFLKDNFDYAYNYDLTFELSEDESYYIVSDKNFTLSTQILNIPPIYNGKEVREIKSEGFTEKKWLNTVILPKTIQKIGDGAFSLCGIKKIIYDCENVSDFNARNWVFYPDTSLNYEVEVIFGKNVKRIPSRLFYPLSTSPFTLPNIKKVSFVEGCALTSIGEFAFYKANIDDISFPSTLTSIGDYSFYQTNLNELRLPVSLTSIGNYAFCSSNIPHIRFNNNLTSIGDYAFYNNSLLQSINLKLTQVSYIGEFAFNKCNEVSYLKFPDKEIEIHEKAFSELTKLDTLDVSSSTLTLYKEAFSSNSNLTNLKVGKLVIKEKDVFSNLSNLFNLSIIDNFEFEYDVDYSIFRNSSSYLKGINIYIENMTHINDYLFYFNNDTNKEIKINNLYLFDSLISISSFSFLNSYVIDVHYVGNNDSFKKLNFKNYEHITYYDSVMYMVTYE